MNATIPVFVVIAASLTACAPVQPVKDCDLHVNGQMLNTGGCNDRDGAARPAKPVPEKPVVTPEAPKPEPTPEPEPEKPSPVCDGGARACRDGEAPTGTTDNPREYLK